MADRYFVGNGIGAGARWNRTANWSTSTGGSGGASVPTSSDAAYLDINSGNCNLDVNAVCLSYTSTAYTGTLSMLGYSFTISGSLTNGAADTLNADGTIIFDAAASIDLSNGGTFTHQNGTVDIDADSTLNADGITFWNLTLLTAGTDLTMTAGDTINIANNLTCIGTNASKNSIDSTNNYTMNVDGLVTIIYTTLDWCQLPVGDTWTVVNCVDGGNNDVDITFAAAFDFVSTQTGTWDDGATWGNASPGVVGTDFPGTTNTWHVSLTHTVTVDSAENGCCGLVEGTLEFDGTAAAATLTLDDGGRLISSHGVGSVTVANISNACTLANAGDLTIFGIDDFNIGANMTLHFGHATNGTPVCFAHADDHFNIADDETFYLDGPVDFECCVHIEDVGSPGIFNANGKAITLGGGTGVWECDGTFTHGNNTVTFDGGHAIKGSNVNFYNLTITNTIAGGGTAVAKSTVVTGDITVASPGKFAVSACYDNDSNVILQLDGSASKSLTINSGAFFNMRGNSTYYAQVKSSDTTKAVISDSGTTTLLCPLSGANQGIKLNYIDFQGAFTTAGNATNNIILTLDNVEMDALTVVDYDDLTLLNAQTISGNLTMTGPNSTLTRGTSVTTISGASTVTLGSDNSLGDVIISATGNLTMGASQTFGSLQVQASGTITGAGYTLTIDQEDAGGIAFNHDGTISGVLDLIITTATTTGVDLTGTAGNVRNLTVNNTGNKLRTLVNATLDGNLTITSGQFPDAATTAALTVGGNVSVASGAALGEHTWTGKLIIGGDVSGDGYFWSDATQPVETGGSGTWDTSAWTGNFKHVTIKAGHNTTLGGNLTCTSIIQEATATITGATYTIITTGETSNYAVDLDGIITGTLNIEINYDGTTLLDLIASSGFVNNLEVSSGGSSTDVQIVGNTTIAETVTMNQASGVLRMNADAETLTIGGLTLTAGTFGHATWTGNLLIGGTVSGAGIFSSDTTQTIKTSGDGTWDTSSFSSGNFKHVQIITGYTMTMGASQSFSTLDNQAGGTIVGAGYTLTLTSETSNYAYLGTGSISGLFNLTITTDANTLMKGSGSINDFTYNATGRTLTIESTCVITGTVTLTDGTLLDERTVNSADITIDGGAFQYGASRTEVSLTYTKAAGTVTINADVTIKSFMCSFGGNIIIVNTTGGAYWVDTATGVWIILVKMYSQKTGNFSGDSTVWNTSRDGSGTDGDPNPDGWKCIQTGDNISFSKDEQVGPLWVESGGTLTQNAYNAVHYGSFILESGSVWTLTSGENIFFKDARIGGALLDRDTPFFNTDIRPDASCQVEGVSTIWVENDLTVKGQLELEDSASDITSESDWIAVTSDVNLRPAANEAFSIYARVVWDSFTADGCIVEQDVDDCYRLYYDGTDLQFEVIVSSVTVAASVTITPIFGKVYHVLATRDTSGYLHLYIDFENNGVSASAQSGALDATGEDITIGAKGGHGTSTLTYHDGKIHEYMYWDGYEVKLAEYLDLINNIYPSTAGEMRLKLNEGSGTTATDSINSHDGTLQTDTWYSNPAWEVRQNLIIGNNGTFNPSTGYAEKLLNHGTITIPTALFVYFRGNYSSSGTVSGSIEPLSYHATASTYTIDDADFDSNNIITANINRARNVPASLTMTVLNDETAKSYNPPIDVFKITSNARTLFEGNIWGREGKGNVCQLTCFDYMYNLRRTNTMRWLYTTMFSRKITPIKSPSNAGGEIGIDEYISTMYFYPALDISYLLTIWKNLFEEGGTPYSPMMGYDFNGPNAAIYAAQYYGFGSAETNNGGDILRVAVKLEYNLTDGGARTGDYVYYYIHDMDEGSDDYDTAIANGQIDISGMVNTVSEWFILDVIGDNGRVKCPNKIKIVLGDSEDHSNDTLIHWVGKFISVNHPNAGKSGASMTEAQLAYYVVADYENEQSGSHYCSEVELSGDWNDKRDATKFEYDGTTNFSYDTTVMSPPSFENITRHENLGSGLLYYIAKVTMFYDGDFVDDHIEKIANDWGRHWFNSIDVNIDGTTRLPMVLIEESIGKICSSIAEGYYGEIWHDMSGANDVFTGLDDQTSTDWTGLADAEKEDRTVVLAEDSIGYEAFTKYQIEKVISSRLKEDAKYRSHQMAFDTGNNINPIYTDLSQSEPYYTKIDPHDGNTDTLLDQGNLSVANLQNNIKTGGVELINIPINAYDVLLTTNELLKVCDSRTGFSEILKPNRIMYKHESGEWLQSADVSDLYANLQRDDLFGWLRSYMKYSGSTFLPGFEDRKDKKANRELIANTIEPSAGFVMSFEVSDTGTSDNAGTYWLLLGSDDSSPGTDTMQDSDESTQLILKAQDVVEGDYRFIVGVATEADVVGEWDDLFYITEIGLKKNATKPAWGAVDKRIVTGVPTVSATQTIAAWKAANPDKVYRPKVPFLFNSKLTVTFGITDSA